MKKIVCVFFLLACFFQLRAQFQESTPRTWDKFPPEAQRRGFGLHDMKAVQMDDDPALEEVLLFSRDSGHYPYFDIFWCYYVILDAYTKEIKYMSENFLSTAKELILEDRNNDGRFELYRRYFQDNKFSTDEEGNKLSVTWMYDRVEWKSGSGKITKTTSK